ncbi:MAG: thioredoxin domain-containing protein [Candidatus Nanohalobium sp.]
MSEEESFECSQCGESFESERGLHIHIGQVHGDSEEPEESKSETGSEKENTSKEPVEGSENGLLSGGFHVSSNVALMALFVFGVAVGLSSGLLVAGSSGFSLDSALPGSVADSTDSSPSNGQEASDSGGSQPTVNTSKIELDGEPILGDENAPVTMVVYEDFQCPVCRQFENGALSQIKSSYVEEGDVRIVWKNFPLSSIHDWAKPAAETMECVSRQDEQAFWSIEGKIFDNQNSLSRSNIESKIKEWAAQEGVSKSAINQCMENGNPGKEVAGDKDEGRSFDLVIDTPRGGMEFVSGTPSSVVYKTGASTGTPVVGPQPFSSMQKLIDSKLAE